MTRNNQPNNHKPSAHQLTRSFFNRTAQRVAKDLLGTVLVRMHQGGRVAGRIVETEAYDGPHDLASHASRGKTPRTAVMFGPAGYTYIYFTYGMHWCLNIVTGRIGYPAAVLIRAVEPLEGFHIMCRSRKTWDPSNLTNGPSRLCQAFGITGKLNARPLGLSSGLWIETEKEKGSDPFSVGTSPRIGVDYAGAYRLKPWRYYLKNNPFVSKN